jgi:hypothetical protein
VSRGVYFLANDTILDQALGFLNSFRTYNPDLPLCLVPFADNADQVRALATRYRFTVWQDGDVLRRCDRISREFHNGRTMGQYRKLAMWTGDFDEFVYIDCDTVVLEPVDFVFEYLRRYDFLTSHSNYEEGRRWVWRESVYETGGLTRDQIEFAANTGFVASHSGLIDPEKIALNLAAPLALAPHMELLCAEQPLLNYLIVTSGLPYSSLSVVAAQTGDADIPQEKWAGRYIGRVENGRIASPDCRRVLLVHWAGEWQRIGSEGGQLPYHDLWHHYRAMSAPTAGGAAEAAPAAGGRPPVPQL